MSIAKAVGISRIEIVIFGLYPVLWYFRCSNIDYSLSLYSLFWANYSHIFPFVRLTLELQCEPQRCKRWASLELIFGIRSIYNLSCELHRFLLASYQLSISAFPLRILKNLFTFFGFCLLVGLFLLLCVSFPFFHRLRFSLSLSLSLRICSSLDYFVDLCAVAYVYDFSACYLVIVGLSVFIIVHTHTHSHSTFNFHWRH